MTTNVINSSNTLNIPPSRIKQYSFADPLVFHNDNTTGRGDALHLFFHQQASSFARIFNGEYKSWKTPACLFRDAQRLIQKYHLEPASNGEI